MEIPKIIGAGLVVIGFGIGIGRIGGSAMELLQDNQKLLVKSKQLCFVNNLLRVLDLLLYLRYNKTKNQNYKG